MTSFCGSQILRRSMPRKSMLGKILLIAKRDYLAVIQTKAFVIGLVMAPILFGGGILTSVIARKRPDIRPRRIAVLDHTGLATGPVIASLERLNRMELRDP